MKINFVDKLSRAYVPQIPFSVESPLGSTFSCNSAASPVDLT